MSEERKPDWEAEMAALVDVINSELRINGPIEVEQYEMTTGREGVRKLVNYLRDKIERIESRRPSTEGMRDSKTLLEIKEYSWREEWNDPCSDLEAIDRLVDAALSQPNPLSEAREAVVEAAKDSEHGSDCALLDDQLVRPKCDCGLAKALARLAVAEKSSEGR